MPCGLPRKAEELHFGRAVTSATTVGQPKRKVVEAVEETRFPGVSARAETLEVGMARQHKSIVKAIAVASVILTSLTSLQVTSAASQEVSGAMQIFHLDRAPINFGYTAINQPSVIPRGLTEADSGVSRGFIEEIDRGLGKIPVNILRALTSSGYRISINQSLVDAVPAARNQQVRGYQAHSTWDTVYGMFNRTTKRVVMAEKAMQPDGVGRMAMVPLRDQQRREGIIRHEFGHAVDQYLGNFSHTPEFIAAYDKGAKSISSYEAKVLNYYLQPGDAGREETFAEIFASLNEAACDRNSDILLKNHFPELVLLIKYKVNKISG
jgi:hypothetical protein